MKASLFKTSAPQTTFSKPKIDKPKEENNPVRLFHSEAIRNPQKETNPPKFKMDSLAYLEVTDKLIKEKLSNRYTTKVNFDYQKKRQNEIVDQTKLTGFSEVLNKTKRSQELLTLSNASEEGKQELVSYITDTFNSSTNLLEKSDLLEFLEKADLAQNTKIFEAIVEEFINNDDIPFKIKILEYCEKNPLSNDGNNLKILKDAILGILKSMSRPVLKYTT